MGARVGVGAGAGAEVGYGWPILRAKSNYTNPQSRRLFRGEGATPKRIAALDIQAKRGADGTNIFR